MVQISEGFCKHCGLAFRREGRYINKFKYCSDTCKYKQEFKQVSAEQYEKRKARFRKWREKNREHHRTYCRMGYRRSVYGEDINEIGAMYKDRYRKARELGYRSGLEVAIANYLTQKGISFEYEKEKIHYLQPAKKRYYVPDIVLSNGIVLELKGRFLTSDRQKHLIIKEQYPDKDIRFVFSNAYARISKLSKTRYCDWCDKNGFKWAHKEIPDAWLSLPA